MERPIDNDEMFLRLNGMDIEFIYNADSTVTAVAVGGKFQATAESETDAMTQVQEKVLEYWQDPSRDPFAPTYYDE